MAFVPARISRPLTVAEYTVLGETESGYTELQEGCLLLLPGPGAAHNVAVAQLGLELGRRLPRDLVVLPAVDIDLRLAPADAPGFSRRPDLIVADRQAVRSAQADGRLIPAEAVLLAVEIISPSSRRMDTVIKRSEYADAGIPHYWILDPADPMSLTACHLAGDFGYQTTAEATGTFTTAEPFPLEIDLAGLVL